MAQNALAAVSIDFVEGQRGLRAIIRRFQENSSVLKVSSVYKHYKSSRKENLNSELWVALKLETELSPEKLLKEFENIEKEINSSKVRAEIYLVAYEKEISMIPSLNLPHPRLHNFPLLRICAAEVWEEYQHPILKESLSQLAKDGLDSSTSEFLAQGKTLLDF